MLEGIPGTVAMSKAVKNAKKHGHPYLTGNFTPIQSELALTPCSYTGTIPNELAGGEYVRNGGNPVTNEALGRDAHWFDGDGMLSGVLFRRSKETGEIQPEFANRYILTDVYLNARSSPRLKTPILPSIATLVSPTANLFTIILRILRTVILIVLSHLPGSPRAIKKISVANTALYYHDGRALVTCESGPPIRVELPSLQTVGWYNGKSVEGERHHNRKAGSVFGGHGIFGWFREWVTAHPRIDPDTKELILYHNTFVPPYVNYSIINPSPLSSSGEDIEKPIDMLNWPVPGIRSAKMMHDFGVSKTHTIIMDLPLSLDPMNMLKNKPIVAYDPLSRSRFGVFPRYRPQDIQWFETNPCCIFHTANSWSTCNKTELSSNNSTTAINMLCCRLTSAALVYSAGDVSAPKPLHNVPAEHQEEEQCRLYYYQFELPHNTGMNKISHQWALAAIPFEFPTLRETASMSAAKYIYGCSVTGTTFGAALGRAVKINSLAKVDVETLIEKGQRNPPIPMKGCVDERGIEAIVASHNRDDPIKVFMMPEGWFTQEARFVPRVNGASEDDGWLLAYVFDESSQLTAEGEPKPDAKSELWIIDAKNMTDVVARIQLPQRVPYGLHGNWISEDDLDRQRPIESLRTMPSAKANANRLLRPWMALRVMLEEYLQ